MGNAFQVKTEKILLQNDHDGHAKCPFQIFMRFHICEANFLKFGVVKALYLAVSEI